MKGFGVFRNHTEIDFSGVELFALTGPTGSGKTTVLDGIVFALYGSVPRHGKGSVAPVITQGLLEAKVSLDFSIGKSVFRVAREVRKAAKGGGASTPVASLESEGEVLATGADNVTAEVVNRLGLDFDQFTTCVLLPQNEFARFLHDRPSDRQELLTALLDLGIYDRVARLALARQRLAEGLVAMNEQRLSELGSMTEVDLETAQKREAALAELLAWVETKLPERQSLVVERRELQLEADRLRRTRAALGSIALPPGLDATGKESDALALEEESARAALETGRSEMAAVVDQGASLPGRPQLAHWLQARQAFAALEKEVAPSAKAAAEAFDALTNASAAVAAARDAIAAAADADRASHLRRGLKVGDPCPVCGQTITKLSKSKAAATIDKAEAALRRAEEQEQKKRRSHAEADNHALGTNARLAELSTQLHSAPSPDELTALAERVESHDRGLASSKGAVAFAQQRVENVEKTRKKMNEREGAIRSDLQTAWSKLIQADLEPPAPGFEDPFGSWKTLVEWCHLIEPSLAAESEKTKSLIEQVDARSKAVSDEIDARLAAVDIGQPGAEPRDAVVDTLTEARSNRARIEAGLKEIAIKTVEQDAAVLDQRRARMLVLELQANRFKEWLFNEVFTALIVGANQRLVDLTSGQYSLDMSGRDFEVIDNHAAGNRRSVKTLSGGETFLVSLALALALADQVAETSTGPARLDSILLDEGFGTLDSETLDTVASVIAEIGASGKSVGIVTHVAELAEQMPVRYEIRKGDDGSAVVTQVRQ
jgi:exonuclease SbcC